MNVDIEFLQVFRTNVENLTNVATIFAVGHLIGFQYEDGSVYYVHERLIGTINASPKGS